MDDGRERPPLVVATENPHKLEEYRALLGGLPVRLVGLEEAGIAALPEETGASFEENAVLKAEHCARASGLRALGDDSGLEVDALGGAPGVRSSRWAPGSDADRVRRLLERLEGVPPERRGARFVCVIAVAAPGEETRTFRGELAGRIAVAPRGEGGFGYDPVLHLPEVGRTVAELRPEEKHRISHRGRAGRLAAAWLRRSLG